MYYYLLNRLPVAFGILILVLPFLSRNRTYRIATLFAALNTTAITILFFVGMWDLETGFQHRIIEIGYFSALTLPALYFASLLLGATVVAYGTRNAIRPLRVALAIAANSILFVYLVPLLLEFIAIVLFARISLSRLGHILRPEMNHAVVELMIATAASALIAILIVRRSENRNSQGPAGVDSPSN